jgi:aminopeptidase N
VTVLIRVYPWLVSLLIRVYPVAVSVLAIVLMGTTDRFGSRAAQEPPAPGVPLALAEERARRINNLRYDLHFTIPADPAARIEATATLRFALIDPLRPLSLDFSAPGAILAESHGRPIAVVAAKEHVLIQPGDLREGENEITLRFEAGNAALNRNAEFMYTLFVPARARLAFPCFDQPDLKAKYTLSLDIPAEWEALSNSPEIKRIKNNDRIGIQFAETDPLPTYLFAFAAGRYQIETAERNGRRFRMFHRETDAAKVARNRDVIFDLHAVALEWLERYTAIKYPFGKFDFLLVPSFQFGGMEHAGAIFYNASGLLLDESATQNQKLGRASVIAHETAHMWFGDFVTMRWFNDVWMKEVFANFMAAKIVNPSFPDINHELRFLLSYYPAAYDVDRTAGTNAIRQRLDNLNEAGTLYGAIIYQKAPIVMRQLEMMLGADGFRDGLREYLNARPFGNASWPDLIQVLDAKTPDDLAAWSHAWVEEAGRPNITTHLEVENGRITRLTLEEKDPAERRALVWTERMEVILGYDQTSRRIPITLNTPRLEVTTARGLPSPQYVLPTGGGIAYGGFDIDHTTRAYLLHHLGDISDALTRGSAMVTLWEDMLDHRARPMDVVEQLIASVRRESDELNLQRMLSYIQQGFWRFVSSAERDGLTPRLERTLREGLDAASTSTVKSAWFSALRDTARTPVTLSWLERVWRKGETVPGLPLAEPDYIQLAEELAVRGVPASQEILAEQFTRIENPDRKARFAFVRPALSSDQTTRDAFFASLREPANRRREPWVLEALSYLHHPLRAESSLRYLPPSLGMLEEIQRTGDIFFPKRWMDATLSGHSSASAARMVRTFLAELPRDYPDRLRRIVLSSADDLFRAAR